jgi:hypothetical protein
MSKGNIILVIHDRNKAVIIEALKNTSPLINDVGELCEFQLHDVNVDLETNDDLSELQATLDKLGLDDYAFVKTIERLEELHIYGSPKVFGLSKIMDIVGYTIIVH